MNTTQHAPPDPAAAARRVAWITGGSRGIGRATALDLAARGHPVAIQSCTHPDAGEETLDAVRAAGGNGIHVRGDVADAAAMTALAATITRELGAPAILVYAAGILKTQFLALTQPEDWRRILAVNLDGAFHALRAVQRGMLRARWGRIVLIGSVAGLCGDLMRAPYAAAKAGLSGLAASAARELGQAGITVNLVAPGLVETDMTADLPAARRERLVQAIPMGRFGRAAEIARAVGFLTSDDAAYITGETLVVDGGMYTRR